MYTHSKSKLFYFFFLVLALNFKTVFAQDVQVDGSLKLHSEFYSANGIDARRPNSLSRGILRLNVNLFDQVRLPFEFILSSRSSEFRQPFNQFGVSPQVSDWLTLHGGYFSTNISELTFGDNRLLGGGVELTPGDFQLKVLYGRSKKEIGPDTAFGRLGRPSQFMYAGSIGYGDPSSNYITLNLLHAKDDSTSIKADSNYLKPEENLTTSISFGIKPVEEVKFSAEIAVSAFSNNTKSDKLDDTYGVPSFLFTPRTSSQVDGAVLANLFVKPSKQWNVRINSRWIGPGFVSLGYAQMPNDLFEITGEPSVRLLDNRLRLRARAGVRYNNLRDNKLATTNRFTGAFFADIQATNKLGFNLQYNNNQISSKHDRDSLRSNYLYNSFGLSVRYNFLISKLRNNVNVTYNFKDSQNENPAQKSSNKNITNSINGIHSIFLNSGWQFGTNVFYSNTELAQFSTAILNISETVSKRLFDNKLSLALTLGYSKTTSADKTNKNMVLKVRSSYSFGEYGKLSVRISNNHYDVDRIENAVYSELYGSINYTLGF